MCKARGDSAWGEGAVGWQPQVVLEELVAGFAVPIPDLQTLLSKEIFCSASLEASDRAAFLTAVSALEPLAEAQPLGREVDDLVDECLRLLQANTSIEGQHRASLEGRLSDLRRESIRQALRRVIPMRLPDYPAAFDVADFAYRLRSELIHKGRLADHDVDIAAETQKISSLLRLIYAQSLGLRLHAPAGV